MKTPVGLRPAAWEPRQRAIAAGVAVVVVLVLVLVWVTGADTRRAGEACDLFEEQQRDLATVVTEASEAAERAAADGVPTVIGSFDLIDRELNSMRRWQSTAPRVDDALSREGDGVDGPDGPVGSSLSAVTAGVAEMQRLVEDGEPAAVEAWVPELGERLEAAADACGEV